MLKMRESVVVVDSGMPDSSWCPCEEMGEGKRVNEERKGGKEQGRRGGREEGEEGGSEEGEEGGSEEDEGGSKEGEEGGSVNKQVQQYTIYYQLTVFTSIGTRSQSN